MKKIISLILCVMLVVTMIPGMALANEEQGGPAVGDISIGFELPSNEDRWIPGWEAVIKTELNVFTQNEENPNERYWERVDGYKPTVELDSQHQCEVKAPASVTVSEGDIEFKIPETCKDGCQFLLKPKAEHNGKTATVNIGINVWNTMYTIESMPIPSKTGVGEIVEFTDLLSAKKHTYIAADGDTEAKIVSETVSNPIFKMEYNWNNDVQWETVGDEENGLFDLRRAARYGTNVNIRLIDENERTLASTYYSFDWLDLWTAWKEGKNGPLTAFNTQETIDFYLEKSTDLTASTGCSIDFAVGKAHDDGFSPFAVEEGGTPLFTKITDENDIVTGIRLNIKDIKKFVQPNKDGDAWFDIETEISYNGHHLEGRTKDARIVESYERYIYNLDESWIMVPGNERGISKFGNIRYEARNTTYPNGHETNLEIVDVTVDPEDTTVIDIVNNGDEWGVRASGIGTAVLKIKHKNPDGSIPENAQKIIPVTVAEDMWRCDINSNTGTYEVLPGDSISFKAAPEHLIAVPEENGNYRDEDVKYEIEWSLKQTEQENVFSSKETSSDTTEFTLSVKGGVNNQDVPIVLEVYALDEDGERVSDDPVYKDEIHLYICRDYYVFDVQGVNHEIQLNETMTVICQVLHCFIDEDGNIVKTPVDASFNCNRYQNVFDADIDVTGIKTTYTFTRKSGQETGLEFEATFVVGEDEERTWRHEFWINQLHMGGNNGSGQQIYWVDVFETNPPENVEDWNNWFNEKVGSEITLRFAVNHNGQLTYLEDIVVHDEHEHIASVTKLEDGSFKMNFKEPGEFRMYTMLDGVHYEMWGQVYRGLSEDNLFYAYTKKTYGNGEFEFIRMENVPSYGGIEIPEFYTNRNQKDEPDEFYILWPTENPEYSRPALNIFKIEGMDDPDISPIPGGSTGIDIADCEDYEQDDRTYHVWKLTVGEDFDMARVGIELKNVPYMQEYTYFLWVLGDRYYPAEQWYCYSGIFAVSALPELMDGQIVPEWSSIKDLQEDPNYLLGADGEYMVPEINMNMSMPANSDRNRFYIIRRAGMDAWMDLTQLHAFHFGGTALGFGGGGQFEKLLDEDTFNFSDPLPVKIGDVDYEAIEVRLNEYIGHSNLVIAMGNNNNDDELMRVKITFGMDVYLKGAVGDIEGRIRDSHNILNEVLGFNPVTDDFNFVDHGNGIISTYFDKACATFNERGQGALCSFDIDLIPGYVVTEISERFFGAEPVPDQNCNFIVNNIYYYDLYNDNEKLNTDTLLDTAGWWYRIGSEENNIHRAACMTNHTVAAYGFENIVGQENVNEFKRFLDGKNDLDKPLSAQKIGAYTDYTLHFNRENLNKQCAIVLTIATPEEFTGDAVEVHGKNNVTIDKLDHVEFSTAENNKVQNNLVQLEGEDLEIKAVYDIQVEDHADGDGVVIVTIAESELDGGNIEDYTVVYFDENGIPMEMQTTYAEKIDENGETVRYLVFTTGHFSKYAVIGKKTEGGSDEDGEGGSGEEGGNNPAPQPPAGGGFAPAKPADSLESAKKNANTEVDTYVKADDYAEAEAAEIKAILDQAKKDIEAAKTAEEVKAIEEAVKAEIDKIETAEELALIAEVESIKFKARSKMTKLNGKKAVKVTWNIPEGMEFDGFDIYRSMKKNSGYSKKPFYTSKSNYYINNKSLKTGKTYYYKVRGFKYVNDEKVYTKWSLKAWRTVK